MRRLICTVAALVLLSACATHVPVPTCPAPIPYSAEQQTQAADELDRLGPGSMLSRMMGDYAAERAALRACND